jgi:hypothetical protein
MFTNAGLFVFFWSFIFIDHFCISELNLRIWQQSKKMLEQTGKRPVVYNNKCGQICGVRRNIFSIKSNYSFALVLRKKGLF